MTVFNDIAILLCLAALFSFLNYRFLKLPPTIALMLISLVLSIGIILLGKLGIHTGLRHIVAGIDFNMTLMVGMLSFLLFAGALHVNLNDLMANKIEITIFATLGVVVSTVIVGTGFYFVFLLFGYTLSYLDCLLFGALISPTDPIAVLGILKKAGAPVDLEVKMSGEALFNDGIGVVVFIVLLDLASGAHDITAGHLIGLLVEEVAGGVSLGLVLGWIAFEALRRVDEYTVEILITLALVTGGYALALKLHMSGPIMVVIAGLMIGNHGRRLAMSDITREHLDLFWELVDEILNAVLFVLIGLEVLMVSLSFDYLLMGIIAIPIALSARLISISLPVLLLKPFRKFSPGTIRVLTWGGLRGGICVALALSLSDGPRRDVFLTMTYAVVAFSLLVQGLTVRLAVPGPAGTPLSNNGKGYHGINN